MRKVFAAVLATAAIAAVILLSGCEDMVDPPPKPPPPPPEEPPTAVLTGAPTGTNGTAVLSVTVSGDRVVRYRHQVTEGADCTAGSYGPETAVETRITDDISALADGPVTLCVLGLTESGLQQTEATKATWVKDIPPPPEPSAVIIDAPTGTNDTTVLSVTVSGTDVTAYRHQTVSGTVCTERGYGPETAVGIPITDDISHLPDGPITLCVLGGTDGVWQTEAASASWVKDTAAPEEPPTAVLTGTPTGTNDTAVLSVTVSGDRVVRYRHQVTEGAACTAGSYGPETAVETRITDDISALADGPITLCVLGLTESGLRQTEATRASWVKDIPPPPEPSAVITGAPTGTNDTTVLSVTVSGTDVTVYRHQTVSGTVCTERGYGPETAVGIPITDDISDLPDGPITLCVIGGTDGVWQTEAASVSWVKDTAPPEEPPTAVLTGAPTGTNDTTTLAVTVSGDRVTRYRHQVTEGAVCTSEGYGPSTPVAIVITDDLSTLDDGPITLCVLGETASGLQQTEATTASWTKDTAPKERYCENGAAAETDPLLCRRGQWTIPGIDQIPLDMVKLTNMEMQSMFAMTDGSIGHARGTGEVLCGSFITTSEWCDRFERHASIVFRDGARIVTEGRSPFIRVIDLDRYGFYREMDELVRMGATIVAHPIKGATIVDQDDSLPYVPMPYLTVQSAGNNEGNAWFLEMAPERRRISIEAFAANKYIFVAGYSRDSSGNYIRDRDSNGCFGIIDGCIWTPFEIYGAWRGTSFSAPNFAAALGSVLTVFPDSTHQNILKLAKACARKTGDGIEELLRVSGGIGVADFSCMGPITDAARNLSAGGSTTVIVDGKTVTVTERELIVR